MADRPAFWRQPGPIVRPSLRACALGGSVAAAAAAWHHHQQQRPAGAAPRLTFSAAAIEAFAGAMGEVAQISLLYPLVRERSTSKCGTNNEGWMSD